MIKNKKPNFSKSYIGIYLCTFVLIALFIIISNVLISRQNSTSSKYYRVEAKRIADEIKEGTSYSNIDLNEYPHILGIYKESGSDFYETNNPYVIKNIDGNLYRIEYKGIDNKNLYITFNIILIIAGIVVLLIVVFITRKILKPFNNITSVPKELAKGNLAVEIPAEKNKYFGDFTWSINMLRESIENDRKREIDLQKDQKLLLLSLSHDIKTPLSAIKLNAKALEKGLYTDEEKKLESIRSINKRADEIESFISQIIAASSNDFINFDITMGEQFLSVIIDKIYKRYAPTLSMSGTDFSIGEYTDCLLSCDENRLCECIGNLMENAIKYGDGEKISIFFEKMDGCMLINVKNTGCNLKSEELNKIFESFNRGSNAANVKGNGLGLFICRKIMHLSDGDVYANIKEGCFIATLVVRMS